MPTLEQQKRNRDIWAKALESGKFKQIDGELGTARGGMCCLGVGCYVLNVPYTPDDAFPPVEFAQLVGLPYEPDYIGDGIEGTFKGGNLVECNDTLKLSFPEIAKIIRTEPTLWEESDFHQAGLATAAAAQAELDALDNPAEIEDDKIGI